HRHRPSPGDGGAGRPRRAARPRPHRGRRHPHRAARHQRTLPEAARAVGPGGRPDDTVGPGGRPDDTEGPGGRPDDTEGPGGRPDDTEGPGGRPDDTAGGEPGGGPMMAWGSGAVRDDEKLSSTQARQVVRRSVRMLGPYRRQVVVALVVLLVYTLAMLA